MGVLRLTSWHGVEPECPICVRSIRDGTEVELRRVPATDAVVGAEVALVAAEPVRCCPVPLGVDEHVVTILQKKKKKKL